MALSNGDSLQALIARRKPGFSLERPFYTEDEIFERDLSAIAAAVGCDPKPMFRGA